EIIRGTQTSDATYATARALAERMGKITVLSKDMPGFIVNRILIPMLNEACFALQEGLASAEDIDTAMKLGTNVPMGPLALADFIGLDTCLYIAEVLQKGLGDDKYRPAPLEDIPSATIAAVNGYALGGGLELAVACDMIFASENARLGLPEVTLGVTPGFGGTQRLVRLVGKLRAKEMIFTGDWVDARRAYEIGLVDAV